MNARAPASIARSTPSSRKTSFAAILRAIGQQKSPPRFPGAGRAIVAEAGLAFCFDRFFHLALFFLFLLLDLVADEFEDGPFRAITHASTAVDNARVAAGAVGKLRRDFAEELLRHGRGHQVSRGLAAGLQSVALPEGDNLFGDGACGLGARQSGGDAAVFKQIGDQVAQGRAAVPRIASQFRSRLQMSHCVLYSSVPAL